MTVPVLGRASLVRADLVIGQGQDNEYPMRWRTLTEEWSEWNAGGQEGSEPVKYGDPIDLSDWSAWMQIRRRVGQDPWVTITHVPSDSGAITLGEDGQIVIWLSHEASSAWGTTNTAGVWDLELQPPGGRRVTFARGNVTVEREVTVVVDDD